MSDNELKTLIIWFTGIVLLFGILLLIGGV
jgi:hypothetical protein